MICVSVIFEKSILPKDKPFKNNILIGENVNKMKFHPRECNKHKVNNPWDAIDKSAG